MRIVKPLTEQQKQWATEAWEAAAWFLRTPKARKFVDLFGTIEEALSRLSTRLCTLIKRYDPTRGVSVRTFVFGAMPWECRGVFSETMRSRRQVTNFFEADTHPDSRGEDIGIQEHLDVLKTKLDSQTWLVFRSVCDCEGDIKEVAEVLGISPYAAWRAYREAVSKLLTVVYGTENTDVNLREYTTQRQTSGRKRLRLGGMEEDPRGKAG